MTDASEHARLVGAWIDTTAKGLATADLLILFERAVDAIWREASLTLGTVTLSAIVDRVIVTGTDSHPLLHSLTLTPTGIGFVDLRRKATNASQAPLRAAMAFFLVELLTIIGSLTAGILSADLHAALGRIKAPDPTVGRGKRMKPGKGVG